MERNLAQVFGARSDSKRATNWKRPALMRIRSMISPRGTLTPFVPAKARESRDQMNIARSRRLHSGFPHAGMSGEQANSIAICSPAEIERHRAGGLNTLQRI